MTIDARLNEALFRPRSVALLGATSDLTKANSRPQRLLKRFGYQGRVLPINPSRQEILGERAYADLESAPGPIDHAFVMVPAGAVPEVIEQCCALHIPVATLFTAGFAELGAEGLRRQRNIVERARAGGLRLLGPNCMGILNVQDRIPLTVNAVVEYEELVPGALSLITQSGSTLGSVLSRAQARGLGFSKLISVGNECDLGVGELADMLVDDETTGAILLFLEAFRDADRLAIAARRAYAAGKPVIVYKLGRSSVGRQAATSHTGAMAGPDEVATAFFREHGIVRVDTFEALFESVQFLKGHQPPRGKRVSVLTGTGGAAAMVVDRLGVLGADVLGPTPQIIADLAAKDIHVSDVPLTDIPIGRGSARYPDILSALLASDHTDAVVSVIGSSAQNPQTIVSRVLAAQHRGRKPLAVFVAPRADDALRALQENGVASFKTPETCADTVNAYLNWRAPGERPNATGEVAAASERAASAAGDRLSERDAGGLFEALGISVAAHGVLRSPADRVDLTGGPFAVKLLSPDILHKTDAGMVMLNVASEDVAAAAQKLLDDARKHFPDARAEGVLVQQMERGLAEVIVGYRKDAEVGPIVMLGMGGITAEITKKVAVRIAPITLTTAHEMIDEVQELMVLRGFRNLPRGDIAGLARALRAISLLAHVESRVVSDAEINPLIVKEEGRGVVAVDGLVVFA